jgi:hypothetical protein
MRNPVTMAINAVRAAIEVAGGVKLHVEEWTMRRLRESSSSWTETEFSVYIRDNFHLHVFISHPHQGANGLGWNARDLYKALRKQLYFRPGSFCYY